MVWNDPGPKRLRAETTRGRPDRSKLTDWYLFGKNQHAYTYYIKQYTKHYYKWQNITI